MQEKTLIRAAVGKLRSGVNDRSERSERIWAFLFSLPAYQSAKVLFAYAAKAGEPETLRFLEKALETGKTVALPYCAGNTLRFFRIEDFDALVPDRFAVPSPSALVRENAENELHPRSGDLILVPGVAFARNGARLGHGLGFYDRFLAPLPKGVLKVGLGFKEQLLEELPEEPFDVRMDYVLTDSELLQAPLPARSA